MSGFRITIDSFKRAHGKLKAHYTTEAELQEKVRNSNFHVLRIMAWRAMLPERPSLKLSIVGEWLKKEIFGDKKKLNRLKKELRNAEIIFLMEMDRSQREVDKIQKKLDELSDFVGEKK